MFFGLLSPEIDRKIVHVNETEALEISMRDSKCVHRRTPLNASRIFDAPSRMTNNSVSIVHIHEYETMRTVPESSHGTGASAKRISPPPAYWNGVSRPRTQNEKKVELPLGRWALRFRLVHRESSGQRTHVKEDPLSQTGPVRLTKAILGSSVRVADDAAPLTRPEWRCAHKHATDADIRLR